MTIRTHALLQVAAAIVIIACAPVTGRVMFETARTVTCSTALGAIAAGVVVIVGPVALVAGIRTYTRARRRR